jgi:hypothetical protein
MMLKREHLDWSRRRAMRHWCEHDYDGAVACFIADLGKHERTAALLTPTRLLEGLTAAHAGHGQALRHWIETFGEEPKPLTKSTRRKWAAG